jgi:hypothetical protein
VDAKMFYLNIGMLKDLIIEFKKAKSYGEVNINDRFCFRAMRNFTQRTKKGNFNLGLLDFTTNSKYARLLKQPLELWMFVPCDEKRCSYARTVKKYVG